MGLLLPKVMSFLVKLCKLEKLTSLTSLITLGYTCTVLVKFAELNFLFISQTCALFSSFSPISLLLLFASFIFFCFSFFTFFSFCLVV